jgi:hypothetical protein
VEGGGSRMVLGGSYGPKGKLGWADEIVQGRVLRFFVGTAIPRFTEAFMIIGRSLKSVGLHPLKIATFGLETELLIITCFVVQVGRTMNIRGL